ncbi:MAG: RNA polymerase sigma factor (sigma-70 family) [Planctomycetota bacterium]|jgi:RNA polymerase sigma factor (sigma-70 family)
MTIHDAAAGSDDAAEERHDSVEPGSEQDQGPDPLSESFSDLRAARDDAEEQSQDLVRRAKDQDPSALNELLTRYGPRLRRIVRIRMGAKLKANMESMDIAQGAMIIGIENLDRFEYRGTGSMLNWLAKIAENHILDKRQAMHAGKRDVDLEVPMEALRNALDDSGLGFDPADSSPGPDQDVARKEMISVIDDCMMELDEDYREAILLRDYCMAPYSMIAKKLGKDSDRAAEGIYYRARIKLFHKARPKLQGLG